METKIVYVLVSNNKDIYLEQLLLSIMSLKHFTPETHVSMVVDDRTDATLKGNRANVLKYIDEKVVVTPPSSNTNIERSRFLKTSLRSYIKGPYLFLDTDTIISEDISEIDSLIEKGYMMAAVKDSHCNFKEMNLYNMIMERAKIIGWDSILINDKIHFNSGVMFVADNESTSNFYKEWHKNWLFQKESGILFDQLSMAYTKNVLDFPIKEIGGVWNCQLSTDGLCYLHKAKIIHYHGIKKGNAYVFQDEDTFVEIKEEGMSEELKDYLYNARGAFRGHHYICNANDYAKKVSPLYKLVFRNSYAYLLFNPIANVMIYFYLKIYHFFRGERYYYKAKIAVCKHPK